MARKLGHGVRRFTAVNLDLMRQYRPTVNIVERPTRLGGRGITLIGHHEITLPLLAAGYVEAVEGHPRASGRKTAGKSKSSPTRPRRGSTRRKS